MSKPLKRITDFQLHALAGQLNQVARTPNESQGTFFVVHQKQSVCVRAGVALVHNVSIDGGRDSRDFDHRITINFTTKRDLYDQIEAFIKGVQFAKEQIWK
jgi:hypothetical protein